MSKILSAKHLWEGRGRKKILGGGVQNSNLLGEATKKIDFFEPLKNFPKNVATKLKGGTKKFTFFAASKRLLEAGGHSIVT